MTAIGLSALASMIVYLLSVVFAWWAMLPVKWDKILQFPRGPQALALRALLAVALGSLVARFLLDYAGFAQRLSFLVG
ncbi:DUF1146 family protein [Exiguobacterium flavidum]|uniref:DUF1146 family protein n=1 Tax=Exiguobacterium flavidum TaxID=2184695 RepID=UPI000DF7D9F1|nr:DUF1146 family protein [Exiguobacterium flavidum]